MDFRHVWGNPQEGESIWRRVPPPGHASLGQLCYFMIITTIVVCMPTTKQGFCLLSTVACMSHKWTITCVLAALYNK